MSLWYRVPLIVAIAIACNIERPLPPPQNPTTVICGSSGACAGEEVRRCTSQASCAEGEVCHLAIGGGVCFAPCGDAQTNGSTDACGLIATGYVCQRQAGSVCAPPCAQGDGVCETLGDFVCQAGACAPPPPPGIRLVNASSATALELFVDDVSVAQITAAGFALEPAQGYLAVTAGEMRVVRVQSGATTVFSGTQTLVLGGRYAVTCHDLVPAMVGDPAVGCLSIAETPEPAPPEGVARFGAMHFAFEQRAFLMAVDQQSTTTVPLASLLAYPTKSGATDIAVDQAFKLDVRFDNGQAETFDVPALAAEVSAVTLIVVSTSPTEVSAWLLDSRGQSQQLSPAP